MFKKRLNVTILYQFIVIKEFIYLYMLKLQSHLCLKISYYMYYHYTNVHYTEGFKTSPPRLTNSGLSS